MNKKIIAISLLSLSFFMAGCTSNKDVKSTSANVSIQGNKTPQAQQSNADNTTKNVTTNATSSQEKVTNNQNTETAQQSNKPAAIYEIVSNVYKKQNIIINYPQIINLGDNNRQSTVNQLIKNDVLSYVNNNIAQDAALELKYSVKLQTSDLLSIKYSGVAMGKGAAHPNNIFYTTNINIKNGTKIRLSDVVKIDENLINAFKKGQYIDLEAKYTKAEEAEIIRYVNSISNNDLIKYFSGADSADIENINQWSTFSYLTKDSIVISVIVPHALGDHAEVSIEYKNIQSNINAKDSVLKTLLNN